MTAYATLAEADAYNTGDGVWDAATTPQKQAGLDYGRKYLDAYYNCITVDESDPALIPVDLKEANSILALGHLSTPLWDSEPKKQSVRSKSVNPGNGVSISKSYSDVQVTLKDPYLQVSLLLQGTCTLKLENPVRSMGVSRS